MEIDDLSEQIVDLEADAAEAKKQRAKGESLFKDALQACWRVQIGQT